MSQICTQFCSVFECGETMHIVMIVVSAIFVFIYYVYFFFFFGKKKQININDTTKLTKTNCKK